MKREDVFAYVYALFAESRDGELTVGTADEQATYCVKWDLQTAETLAHQCDALLDCLTRLARYEKPLTETWHLTKEEMEVWHTYLRPFPDHGLDKAALKEIWEKETVGESLTPEEQILSRQYADWYEENALTRLPFNRCAPTDVISRARRYVRLVQLNAPVVVQESETRCLIEEMVLYYCMV